MRPGPRRSLTHAEILDVAFDLLEAKGFAAVSVRGVASGLGLTPTALYTYYPSKNALLRGMVEQLLARLDQDDDAPTVAGAAGARGRLLALALRLRELLTGHAGALGLIMSGPLDGPNAMRLNETLLESFMAAGLGLDDAARAAYALQVYALGSIALESADLDVEADAAGTALWTDLATFPLSEQTAAAQRTPMSPSSRRSTPHVNCAVELCCATTAAVCSLSGKVARSVQRAVPAASASTSRSADSSAMEPSA